MLGLFDQSNVNYLHQKIDFLKQEWKNQAQKAKDYLSDDEKQYYSDSSGNNSEMDEIKVLQRAREKHRALYPNWQCKDSDYGDMKEVNPDQEDDEEEEGWHKRDLIQEKRSSSILHESTIGIGGDSLEFRPPQIK